MDNQRSKELARAMDGMPKLESLCWSVENADGWRDAVASMTRLRSLALYVPPDDFALSDVNLVMQVPPNLRELSVIFDEIAGWRGEDEQLHYEQGWDHANELLASAAGLIGGAPNLESLSIRLQDAHECYHWTATQLVPLISEMTYPNLRSIRVSASEWADSDASTFSGLFTESVLWKFLGNHPHLYTVVLDTDYDNYHPPSAGGGEMVMIHPDRMTSLMPSVRHFEGPCVMFEALIFSDLGQQVETLGLLESGPPELGKFRDLLPRLGRLFIPELPRLKCLKLYGYLEISNTLLQSLLALVRKMPMIESLILGFGLSMIDEPRQLDPSKYLKLLEALPRLRTLALPAPPFPANEAKSRHKRSALTGDPKSFFMAAGQLCPELESIHWGEEKCVRWPYSGRWDIIRREPRGAPVDIVYVCAEDSQEPPMGWEGAVMRYEETPFWPNDFFYDNNSTW